MELLSPHRLASRGIVALDVRLSRCVYVCSPSRDCTRVALVSAAKVMRCIQCSSFYVILRPCGRKTTLSGKIGQLHKTGNQSRVIINTVGGGVPRSVWHRTSTKCRVGAPSQITPCHCISIIQHHSAGCEHFKHYLWHQQPSLDLITRVDTEGACKLSPLNITKIFQYKNYRSSAC